MHGGICEASRRRWTLRRKRHDVNGTISQSITPECCSVHSTSGKMIKLWFFYLWVSSLLKCFDTSNGEMPLDRPTGWIVSRSLKGSQLNLQLPTIMRKWENQVFKSHRSAIHFLFLFPTGHYEHWCEGGPITKHGIRNEGITDRRSLYM